MELIGNESCVREEFAREVLEGITKIHDHVSHIFATRDVREADGERACGLAVNDFHHPSIRVVDDHGGKLGDSKPLVSSERMLIDANRFWPRIEPGFPFELELFIESLEHEA